VILEPLPWDDHKASLQSHGMRAEHFIEALGASNTERRKCVHKHCAKSGPGYYAYNGMLTSLSGQMCDSEEWEREDPLSMPLLINHGRKIAIAVSSGDQYTGLLIPRNKPRSKNPKGALTRELARLNQIANADEGFFPVPEIPLPKALAELEKFTFWLTLVFFDRDRLEIRCEVSQPISLNSQGQVNDYCLRIILPPYSLSDEDFPDDDDPNDGFGPITVDVTRR
jgi:hypothetical protein